MHASHILAAAGFEAARQLPGMALHGHSFRVQVRTDAAHTKPEELDTALARAIAPFDYAHINDRLTDGSDLSLARHIAAAMPMPVSLRLDSAGGRATLIEQGDTFASLTTRFEAAHQLPHVGPGHKCGRLHGHGFIVTLVARAPHDHAALAMAWEPLYQRLNHAYLNNITGLENPTSEVMALWLYQQLLPVLPQLAWVEVRETHSAGSQYDGARFRIWKEQRFESAVPFGPNGVYTGHSYLIRLMLSGSLDQTMGWLLDFGDVKDRFKPVYRQLDHNPLDKLPGIRDSRNAGVAEWVHAQLAPLVPELSRIDLLDRPGHGVSLHFHDDMRWPLMQEL